MKNRIRIIVTTVLLLAASSAAAGLISSPLGVKYASPELVQVDIENLGDDIVKIHTTGLTGELSLKGSDFPPEYEVPASATGKLSFVQDLELVINLSLGVVEGRASGQYTATTVIINDWIEPGRVTAICLPLNGRDCGQLVVDLELQGVLTDANDPSIVGQLRTKILGSFVWDGTDVGHWAAMSGNVTLGVNEVMINSLVEFMDIIAVP